MNKEDQKTPLAELAGLFLKLGFICFGGPVAHIAIIEQETVTRRNWLSRETFLDMMAVTNLIPGPNSTELAMYVGYQRRGAPGLLVSGACFILPSAFLTGLLAWVYLTYGSLPSMEAVFTGLYPVVTALIAIAIYKFTRKAIIGKLRAVVMVLTCTLFFLGLHPVLALLIGGLVHMIAEKTYPKPPPMSPAFMLPLGMGFAVSHPLLVLFSSFFKIGLMLFGSGYVLLPYMQHEFVTTHALITQDQLVTAIAAGQITPGPILCAATFVGYMIEGPLGAVVATVAIFLPAFLLVAWVHRIVPHLQKSAAFKSFLSGAVAGSVGLMFGALWQIGAAKLTSIPAWGMALAALGILLWKPKLSPFYLMIGGAALGKLLQIAGII